jgi:hypothetical protein
MWGELFLGDFQNNLLAVIKERAEAMMPRRDDAGRVTR